MKREITILIIALSLMAGACTSRNQDERAIRRAAKGYLHAVGNYRMDEAIPYATRNTRENTIPTFKRIMFYSDTAYMNSNKPAKIKLQRVAMLSDTDAWVFYHKHTPIKDVDDSVYVCLEDGQWLVDVRLKPIPFLPPDTIRRKPDGNTPIKRLPIDRNASHTTSVPRGK